MSNRLAASHSPYLLQHKENPVHWQPWDSEALQRARDLQRPIFLSIGYSSCHWCHVMEHESFSDPEVAKILNEFFVSIKVDREERPDLDHIYMTALQMMTGHGGWPLNIFLTPDLKPFFGGTYFAPDSRYGRPPFQEVLRRLKFLFETQRDQIQKNADQMAALLAQKSIYFESSGGSLKDVKPAVIRNIIQNYDTQSGGLGGAPKFFHVDGLRYIWREGIRRSDQEYKTLVEHSLTQMILGGVYDQVGGGFHRYSTDAQWRVPHFEKMLYDNALLSSLLAEVVEVNRNPLMIYALERILQWVTQEMRSPHACFYSSMDADTEHEEGKFYTWKFEELKEILKGADEARWLEVLDVSPEGVLEGRNVLAFRRSLSEAELKDWGSVAKRFQEVRAKRVAPAKDTKILVSLNGLMISALAKASKALRKTEYLQLAEECAQVILKAYGVSKQLRHLMRDDEFYGESFLEDYAYFIEGLLDLYEEGRNEIYKKAALQLCSEMVRGFYDSEAGGFWSLLPGREDVLVRYKEIHDGALPSPYAVACSCLLRISRWQEGREFQDLLERALKVLVTQALESPGGFHRYAMVVDEML